MSWQILVARGLAALLACAAAAAPTGMVRAAAALPEAHPDTAVLSQYCFTCHNDKRKAGGLVLETKDLNHVGPDAETWEKVVRKLRMGAMPPPGLPRPDAQTTDAFVQALEGRLDQEAALHPNPGRTEALHRLNRSEYRNAVRDLVGLDIDTAALLPPDDSDTQGLDNNAGMLSVSPALLERYLTVARRVSRLALAAPSGGPGTDTFKVSNYAAQEDQGQDLPFGTRGGASLTYNFPTNGEYVIAVRLRRSLYGYIMGLQEAEQLEVRVDGVRVKTFKVGGEDHGMTAPRGFAGELYGDPDWERWVHEADAGLDVRVPVKAGPRVVSVAFVGRATRPQDALIRARSSSGLLQRDDTRVQAVDTIAITGPYATPAAGPLDTPSLRRILVCRPKTSAEEEPCARRIVSSLAGQAYRRPVTAKDVQTIMAYYRDGRKTGDFKAGLQEALSCILASPDFLFRVEHEPARAAPGAAYRISDLELASRLSFFLWSSIPDRALVNLAVEHKLHQPAVLDQQVKRMIADPRSKALVDNFVGQWLLLRNLRATAPDQSLFPGFDEALRDSFEQETTLFFNDQLQRDQSVVQLLSARYTFLNERLANHYGIPGVYGTRFRRVDIPAGIPRGGLLGQGSLLMVTSYPNRTSPVLRGKWVLSNLLGTPPPQPPPNVPGLKDTGAGGKPATVRARLEEHRKNPVCAACHASMDPLGFALENFDATGKWRTVDAGAPIDSSGVLPNGTKFQGPDGLRDALLARKEQFVQAMTERLLSYALGRQLEAYDMPTVRKIVHDARPDDYRWRSIIGGIVKSEPFLMRTARTRSVAAPTVAEGGGKSATALQ
ncbi:MAG TPA: DUF1592 domain-containing protein [Caulobacteraceae bacterium]|nr:DUF1592 domain-containing protein [Caulobacteraceae bacterium]